jgi:hypothetical protein
MAYKQLKRREPKMKTRKTIFGIMGGMDAAVSNTNGVFAKQKIE